MCAVVRKSKVKPHHIAWVTHFSNDLYIYYFKFFFSSFGLDASFLSASEWTMFLNYEENRLYFNRNWLLVFFVILNVRRNWVKFYWVVGPKHSWLMPGFRFVNFAKTNCKAENLCEIGRVSKYRNAIDAIINFGTLLPPKILFHSATIQIRVSIVFQLWFPFMRFHLSERVSFVFIAPAVCKPILVGIPSVSSRFITRRFAIAACDFIILEFCLFLSVRPSLS